MNLLKTEDVSSVILFDLCVSEGELQFLADSLGYLLKTLDINRLHEVFADESERTLETPLETKDFAEELFKELMDLIKDHCREEFLPARYKEWRGSDEKPSQE